MAAQIDYWPVEQPSAIGDDLTMIVTFHTLADITGWEWEAAIRSTPGGPVIARWTVDVDETAKVVTLYLPEAESLKVRPGCGFDLRQTAPDNFVWLTVNSLNMIDTYSYEAPVP